MRPARCYATMPGHARRALCALLLVLPAGCDRLRPEQADEAELEAVAGEAPRGDVALTNPRLLTELTGFSRPESVLHDAEQDVYFVANMAGDPAAKDNNGFISRIRPDGGVDSLRFVQGGRAGLVLHAPKGMAIIGRTLWVADIDVIRAFDRVTGEGAGGLELAASGARFLNDLAVGGDGALYASDTDAGRVYRITPELQISVLLEADTADGPNGLLWDAAEERLLIAAFRGQRILAWVPGDSTARPVAPGPSGLDGLARFGTGPVLVSSLSENAVFVLRGGALEPLLTDVAAPADIGVDAARRRLLVPLLAQDRVQIWEFGGG